MTERIVILIDMDCFYVQVEERDNPHIKGKPAAVVQYNTWKGGGIIAVNYEARKFGVKRGMRGDEAKEKCPEIYLVQVPVQRGKADLTKYRNAGKEVVSVLCHFSDCVERASIDEAYIDVTKVIREKTQTTSAGTEVVNKEHLPSTWVIGYDQEKEGQPLQEEGISQWLHDSKTSTDQNDLAESVKLSLAAHLCEQMRKKVLEETGFKCSAGISCNKMLAKLACGLHKPNQQTILPMKSVPLLWTSLPLGKVRNLGGKLGDSLKADFHCVMMSDLAKLAGEELRTRYDEKTTNWLLSLGRGIDYEPVISRQLPKSIGCGKNFNGKEILNSRTKVKTWMKNLADELSERLNEDKLSNDRVAKTLSVHVKLDSEEKGDSTRSCFLPSYKAEIIAKTALGLITSTNTVSSKADDKWDPPIRNISLSASKFDNMSAVGTLKINDIFKKVDKNSMQDRNMKTKPSLDDSNEKNGPSNAGATPSGRMGKNKASVKDPKPNQSVGEEVGGILKTVEGVGGILKTVEEVGGILKTVEEVGGLLKTVEEVGGLSKTVEEVGGLLKTVEEVGGILKTVEELEGRLKTVQPTDYKETDEKVAEANGTITQSSSRAVVNREPKRKKKRESDSAKSSFFLQFLSKKNAAERNGDFADNVVAAKNGDHPGSVASAARVTNGDKPANAASAARVTNGNRPASVASAARVTNGDHPANAASAVHAANGDQCPFEGGDNGSHLEVTDESIYEVSTDVDEDTEGIGAGDRNGGTSPPSKRLRKKPETRVPCSSSISSPKDAKSEPEVIDLDCSGVPTTADARTDPSYVSVDELFPDLNNVDWSLVGLLPDPLKSRVTEELKKRRIESETKREDSSIDPSTSNKCTRTIHFVFEDKDGFKLCKECNRKIPDSDFITHSDYHYALELRKQQLLDAKQTSPLKSAKAKTTRSSKTQSNINKRLSKTTVNDSQSIERFFKKK